MTIKTHIGTILIGCILPFVTYNLLVNKVDCISKFFGYNQMRKTAKKCINPKENTILSSYSVLNLTPHTINLYDNSKNLLFGIKTESKEMQLRLVTNQEANKNTTTSKIVTNNVDFDFTKKDELFMKNQLILLNNVDRDHIDYIYCSIPVQNPVVYDKVEGIENLRKYLSLESGEDYDTIIVSAMVAEFMINHKEDFADMNINVLVSNPDPKNIVRDEKGIILGVEGFINYGRLAK